MKITLALFTLLMFVQPLAADEHHHHHHDHHAETLETKKPSLPGDSLYNLESKWVSSQGKSAEFSSLQGPVRVVAMLYTSCQTACPMITHDMKQIRSQLPDKIKDKVHMTVFSFDPKRDTPIALQGFKEKHNLKDGKWDLFSPSGEAAVNELAAALGVQFKKLDNGEYIHSNTIFLLSHDGRILAQKEGLSNPSQKFVSEIKRHVR